VAIQFRIETVFDLSTQAGLLASGWVLDGVIRAGQTLRDERTGAETLVIGVEFQSPRDRERGQVTLQLSRTAPSPVVTGAVLSGR
jgi:hypothetical protein